MLQQRNNITEGRGPRPVCLAFCCRLRPGVIDQLRVLAGRGYYSSRDLGTKRASAESEKAADSWPGFVGSGQQVLMVSHHCIVLYSIIDEGYGSNKPFTDLPLSRGCSLKRLRALTLNARPDLWPPLLPLYWFHLPVPPIRSIASVGL